MLEAHATLLKHVPDALCLLLPRHPERGGDIARLARERGFSVALRSRGEDVEPGTQVYVADTIGETGLWYRAAPLVFLAGSFGSAGGHNPWEPVACGAALLHGPNVPNAAQDYAALTAAGAAREVGDATALAAVLGELLADPAALEAMRGNARASAGQAGHLADGLAQDLLRLMDGPHEG